MQEIFQILTVAFGNSTMSRTQVQLWYNWFKKGREDVNDVDRPGRPRTSTTDENIAAVKKMIFWIIFESLLEGLLMMLAYLSTHAKQFLWMF